MKINENESTAVVIGEIQSNAVSIDIKNIGFITQLLSTNLYSKPIDSFLREIVSNAWDSHVEAGNTEPILLEIGTDTEGKHYCRIQDFGIGLSPERFNDIYRNIGSSTKRADNTQIGGFGIGRFSALAYSGSVYLTSNHDGIKYKYLMYKDGNIIKIDELFNAPTEDANGLEVMVYVRDQDIDSFKRAIKAQLPYFENLYLSFDRYNSGSWYQNDGIKNFVNNFNNLRIKKYKHFSVNSFGETDTTTLCLGKIQYPLNKSALLNTSFKFDENYPIAVNFEIGDLEVTPNREQILYTRNNVKKIEEKLDLVQEEIEEIIKKYEVQDFTDLDIYVNYLKNKSIYIPILEDNENGVGGVNLKIKKKSDKITFNGEKLDTDIIEMYDFIRKIKIPANFISFRTSNGKIETKSKENFNVNIESILVRKDQYFVTDYTSLTNISKDYLRNNYINSEIFFKYINPYKIRKYILEYIKERENNYYYNKLKYNKKYIKIILTALYPKITNNIKPFSNKDVPQQYIDDRNAEIKAKRSLTSGNTINWKEEVNLFVLRENDRTTWGTRNVTTDSKRVTLDDIKKKWNKFPIIYSVKDDEFLRDLYYVFHNIRHEDYSKYKFIEIAPTKIKILKDFPNFIKIEEFMDIEYKKIRKLATARLIVSQYPHLIALQGAQYELPLISDKLTDIVAKINNYVSDNSIVDRYNKYNADILNDIDKLCADHNYYDEEMIGYIKENIKYVEGSEFLTLITDTYNRIPRKTINFVVATILKNKLFRPNLEAVKNLRKETIFNLKEKNESN